MRLPEFPPFSIIRNRLVPGHWDVLAFFLVIAFFVYLAEAAHGLIQPLARLEATPITLNPWALIGYSARTGLLGATLELAFEFALGCRTSLFVGGHGRYASWVDGDGPRRPAAPSLRPSRVPVSRAGVSAQANVGAARRVKRPV